MELIGGYKIPYDPWPALNKLKANRDNAIEELWENLYHQGDVGSASYAAVPELVKLGELSLVAAIEVARNTKGSPLLPNSIESDYFQSLSKALEITPENEEQLQGYYVIHASVNGQHNLAKAVNLLSVEEILNEYN